MRKLFKFIKKRSRGDLPEMTGKAWIFVAVIVGVVVVFGPQAVGLVKNALNSSIQQTNNAFNINNY